MAHEVEIRGSAYRGKVRDPLGVVILGLVTFGIYYLVWYYKTNKEMAQLGTGAGTEECGTSPGTSLLAVTLGALVVVPALVSLYRFCKRLSASERVAGAPEGIEAPLLFLVLIFIGPVGHYLFQRNLNRVLEAQSGTARPTA